MANQGRVRWTGEGTAFDGASGRGARVAFGDEAPRLSPADDLLLALAGCTAMDVISILQKKRQPVAAYAVAVSGTRRSQHPRVYTEIDVLHEVDGEGVEVAAVHRAIQLSATKYCTVSATLATGDVIVHHRCRVRNAAGEHVAEVVATGPQGRNVALGGRATATTA